jgi:hypothetical protein
MRRRIPSSRIYLSDLVDGYYIEQEGDFDPNYILTPSGEKVYRAKAVATIVAGPYFSDDNSYARLLLDDGTGIAWGAAFRERAQLLKGMTRGDLVQLIAKPREWQDNKQLNIEVIAKIDAPFYILSRAETVLHALRFREEAARARNLLETSGSMRRARELAKEENIDLEVLEGVDELSYLREKEKEETIDVEKLEVVKKRIADVMQMLQTEDAGVELDVLIAELDQEFTSAEVEEGLKELLSDGDVYEPSVGKYMLA